MNAPAGVLITAEAAALLAGLQDRHGPVMFHQSGGCCDGSAPMCYPRVFSDAEKAMREAAPVITGAAYECGERPLVRGLVVDLDDPDATPGVCRASRR